LINPLICQSCILYLDGCADNKEFLFINRSKFFCAVLSVNSQNITRPEIQTI